MDSSGAPVALVTGATRGIGRAVAGALARRGATVVLGARRLAQGQEAARAADPAGRSVAVALDVTDESSVASAAAEVGERFGRLDVLVNNAGVLTPDRVPTEVTAAAVRREYEANVFGVVAVVHAFAPLLRRSAAGAPVAGRPGRGRIVNVSSEAGSLTLLSDPSHPASGTSLLAYASSKAALNALTAIYAGELAADGVDVVSVCPGYVATDLNGHRGTATVDEAAALLVGIALAPEVPTGSFLGAGGVVPW